MDLTVTINEIEYRCRCANDELNSKIHNYVDYVHTLVSDVKLNHPDFSKVQVVYLYSTLRIFENTWAYSKELYLYISQDILNTDNKELIESYLRAIVYTRYNIRAPDGKPIDLSTELYDISEYAGSIERCKQKRESFLADTKLFKKKVKGNPDFEESINRLKDLNLICDQDLEGIEIYWYTSTKYQSNYTSESSREKMMIVLHKNYNNVPKYVIDYTLYYLIKLMNAEYRVEGYDQFDADNFKLTCMNIFPTKNLLIKFFDDWGNNRYCPQFNCISR